ncbi:MAG TPA: FKBP-type peptidyl-prolyl cis-trans isomerase, partial [Thermoanaerobaculia bacterium]|nr:FKBP-type peptidyl-prolyl cis-trans isomerase [Thermoanaerobaculia bacterium]
MNDLPLELFAHCRPLPSTTVYILTMRYPAFLIAAAALMVGFGCRKDASERAAQGMGEPESLQYAPALNVHLDGMTKTPSGLYYLDRETGSGPVAEQGKRASFSYVGYMPDGRVFDRSQPGSPYRLVVGNREVIAGMD